MHPVKLMLRKTGERCLLRKARQIKLEGMNIITGARDHGLLHETRNGPEAELRLGPVEEMPTKTGMNPGERTRVTADTGEADLRPFIPSEGILRTHLETKRMIYILGQNALLIVSAKSPCIPALQKSDQRIKSIPEAQTRIHGYQITILPSR